MIRLGTSVRRLPARAAILFAGAIALSVNAAEAPSEPAKPVPQPPPRREIWVPTDHLEVVLKKMPRAVMLTPDQYRTLLRDAERIEKPEDPALKPPVASLVREVAFEGELTNEIARITARYSVESFTDEWSEIPIILPWTRLAHVEVDDQSALRVAPPTQGKKPPSPPVLVVRGKGEHHISAEFHLPVSRSPAGNAIQFSGPGVAAASMRLTVPDGAKLDSSLPFITGEEDPNVAKFVLPAQVGQPFEIRWTARDIDAIPDAAIFQTCSYLYSIDSTRVQADLGLVLSSSLADLPNRFRIVLPEGVRILSVEGSELLSWDAVAADSGTGIEVVLVGGKRQAADLRILAEADVEAEADADVTVALPIAEVSDVHRASGTMALIGSDDVRVKNITTGPLTVAAPEALGPAVLEHPNFVAGFRFPVTTTPPEVTLSPVRERFNAQLDTRIELKREAIHLARNLTVIPQEGRLFETELELPAAEELLSITPAGRGGDFSWNRIEGNRVRLAWREGLVEGDRPPALAIESRRDPENWFELDGEAMALSFANAEIAAAETVSGYVAVAFDESFRVETVTADGLEPRDSRTTPVSGALAWFRLSDYALELNAARRATEIEAAVIAYALPLQSSLEIEGQLDLEIRYTPISELVVKLNPAIAEFVRWDSPLLAEKRLDEDTGEWTLDFHDELSGSQRFRFRMALPFEMEESGDETEQKRFAVAAPVFTVPAAKRVRGDWIIEANTDTELDFEANGVDAVDSLRAPAVAGYRPRHRVIAAYQYRGDEYELKIAGTRHAPEELVTTVVDALRIDTVVSIDGSDRHQAQLGLRTSGEQFLEIGLPEGAVVWTLTVDGAAVKPVSVQNASDTLRVQLPAYEDASRRTISLKLIYQTPGKKWGGSGREELEPIRLAERIPVMRSDWFLHLPEGFDYQRFKSNLREGFEVIDRTLLGQVWQERERFLPGFAAYEYATGEADMDSAVPEVAARYTVRMQERVSKADEAAIFGSQLLTDGDFQGAIAQFQAALDLLPAAPVTRKRFEAYLTQFANSSVKLSQQRADEAEYEEARSLLEAVLSPGVDPDNFAAKQLLERLDDPEYYSPALTPEHYQRVRRVEEAQRKARGYVEMGDYDNAEREYWAVLNDDPYNNAARRSLEGVERDRMKYYEQSRNHTRAEFLRRVAEGWELPVPASVTALNSVPTAPGSRTGWEIPQDLGSPSPGSDLGDRDTDRIAGIEKALKTTIIPTIDFVNTPLPDALDYLRAQAQRFNPRGGGVNFILDLGTSLGGAADPFGGGAPATPAPAPGMDPFGGGPVFDTAPAGGAPGFGGRGAADTQITLNLSNVPLGEALGYVLKLSNLKYKVEPQAVVILPLHAPDREMFAVNYAVPPELLPRILREGVPGGQSAAPGPDPFAPDAPAQTPRQPQKYSGKELFESYGVTFGPGAGVVVNESTGRMMVRQTRDQHDLVQAVMESLRQNFDPGAPNLWAFRQSREQMSKGGMAIDLREDDMLALKADTDTDRVASVERKLKSIIVPSLEFVETPLRDALDFLRTRALEIDPDPDPNARGVDFVIGLPNLPAGAGGVGDTKITLKLTNVPLGEAVGYTLKLANLKYKVEPQAVVILPISAPDTELYTNTYIVPPSFLSSAAGGDAGGGAAPDPFAAPAAAGGGAGVPMRMTAKEVLEAYGVAFGPGSAATYNPQSSTLIVRAPEDQMNLVEASIQSLRASPSPSRPEEELLAMGILPDSEDGEEVPIGRGLDLKTALPGGSSVIVATESGDISFVNASGDLAAPVNAWKKSLNDLVIPEFKCDNLSLPQAVQLLENKAKEQAGGHPAGAPRFQVSQQAGGAVSLDLKNVPLGEALSRLTSASGTEYRVTASGVVIAAPGSVPPESLQTLVLELPNSAFEVTDGSGGIYRISGRSLLTGAGIAFPPGTSAAYNRTTQRLAVRNTSVNLQLVRELFDPRAGTDTGAFAASTGQGSAEQVFTSAQSLGLKGFDSRHAGLIPLDFELPQSGRSYSFSGLYAPEPIRFRYVNWERQIRFAWIWILAGGLGFWFVAVRKLKRPVVIGVLGIIVLTFVPLIVSQSLLAFCNSLLIGWLLGAALWLVWTIRMWLSRVFADGEKKEVEAGEEAAVSA